MYDLLYTRTREDCETREHSEFVYIMPVSSFFTNMTMEAIRTLHQFFKDNSKWLKDIDWDDARSVDCFQLPAQAVTSAMRKFLKEKQDRPRGHFDDSVTHATFYASG